MIIIIFIFLLTVQIFLFLRCINHSALYRFIFIAFNTWWDVILVVSFLHPYGDYAVLPEIFYLVIIFLIAFDASYVMLGIREKQKSLNSSDWFLSQFEYLVNINGLYYLSIMVNVYLAIYAVKYTYLILNMPYMDKRDIRFEAGFLFKNGIELYIYNWIIGAYMFLVVFCLASFIANDIYKKRLFIAYTITFLLYLYIGAGRMIIVMLGITIILMLVLKNDIIGEYNKLFLKKGLIIICILLSLMFVIGAFRMGRFEFNLHHISMNISMTLDHLLIYNIGSLSGMSLLYSKGLMDNFHYNGRLIFFSPIDNVISALINHWSDTIYLTPIDKVAQIISETRAIGNQHWNALYSCIYWFYVDAGLLGVVVYSVMFGLLSKIVVYMVVHNCNIGDLMILAIIFYAIMTSNMNIRLNNWSVIIYIFFCFFIKNKIKMVTNVRFKVE